MLTIGGHTRETWGIGFQTASDKGIINMPTDRSVLIEFPCTFQIKVMGAQHPEFETAVLETVRIHAPETQSHHISTRPSSKGNYLGASVNVYVTSQAQLDDIYRALTSHEMVKVVL